MRRTRRCRFDGLLSYAALLLASLCAMCCAGLACADELVGIPHPAAEVAPESTATADALPVSFRTPKENWILAKRTIREDPSWGQWMVERSVRTEHWMASTTDHAGWVAGWGHDYLDSEGRRREWRFSDAMPAVEAGKLRGAWIYWFRRRHVETIEEAAYLYRLSSERKYLEFVIGQVDFYAEHYLNWTDKRRVGASRIMGQGLDEAMFFIRLAEAARLVRDAVDSQRWQRWSDLLFKPAAVHIAESISRVSNISLWQLSAAGMLTILVNEDNLLRRVLDGRMGFRQQVAHGVLKDGLWFEGSLGYNAYAAQGILPLVFALMRHGLHEQYTKELKLIRDMLLAPMSLQFVSGSFPNPGDNTGDVTAATLAVLVAARQALPTRLGTALSIGKKSWATLLDAPDSAAVSLAAPVRSSPSALFADSRMAMLRSAGWEAFLHWGQNSSGHAQREALNVELVYRGVTLTRDLGTPSYGSPMHAGFFTQAAAHNVPFADDVGQVGTAPGDLVAFDPQGREVAIVQPQYQKKVSALRRMTLVDGQLNDEVQIRRSGDNAGAASGASVGLSWIFDCPLNLPADGGRAVVDFPQSAGFRYWRPLSVSRVVDRFKFQLVCHGQVFDIDVCTSGEFFAYAAESPDLAGSWRPSVYFRKTALEGVFVTTIRPAAPLVNAP